MPKYNSLGNEIQYKVEEQEKNEGDLHFYTPTVSEVTNVEGETDKKQATITNTFTRPQDETQITVPRSKNTRNHNSRFSRRNNKSMVNNNRRTTKI